MAWRASFGFGSDTPPGVIKLARADQSKRRGPAPALKRVALAAASLLLVLLVAEGIARLSWPEVEHRAPAQPSNAESTLSRLDLARPNRSGFFKGTFYRSNRGALRGPEYTEHPEPGGFRIAVAGDSVTAGLAVDEEDTYAQVLERLLNEGSDPRADRARSDRAYEVVNMGLDGLNAHWVMNRMERASQFYRFQLAVYGWTPNDIEGPHYEEVGRAPGWGEYWAAVARYQNHPSYLVRTLWPRFMSLRAPKSRPHHEEIRRNYEQNDAAWADFTSALDDLARFTKQRGICGHVFIHSWREELLGVHDRVAEAARERGLSVSRSMPALGGRKPSEFWVSLVDAHPNVAGHALLAQALYDGLHESLPPACWAAQIGVWPEIPPPRRAGRAGSGGSPSGPGQDQTPPR